MSDRKKISADKKQFSNTKSIVNVETGIVTLISYRHYLKIVGNNKLWPDMQKESWNIHSTKILIGQKEDFMHSNFQMDIYKSIMDWCSVYLTPQGLPKHIYLSPPLIFPTVIFYRSNVFHIWHSDPYMDKLRPSREYM
jgi:hypothetical protein